MRHSASEAFFHQDANAKRGLLGAYGFKTARTVKLCGVGITDDVQYFCTA